MFITTRHIKNSLLVLVVSISLALLLTLVLVSKVHAAEINPAPGTYSYGSTSEFSPYSTLSQGSDLAPTGQSQAVGYIVVGLLLIGAGTIIYISLRRRKHTSTPKIDQAS